MERRWSTEQILRPVQLEDLNAQEVAELRDEVTNEQFHAIFAGSPVEPAGIRALHLGPLAPMAPFRGFIGAWNMGPPKPMSNNLRVFRALDGIPFEVAATCAPTLWMDAAYDWIHVAIEAFSPNMAVPAAAALELCPKPPRNPNPALGTHRWDEWAAWAETSRAIIELAYPQTRVTLS